MAVIDLRGSPTGLGALGEGLASLIEALKADPDDEMRQMLLENPQLGAHLARTAEQHQRDIQSGTIPVDPRLGDAGVPTEELSLPTPPGFGMFSPTVINEAVATFPETDLEKFQREQGVAEAKLGAKTATRSLEIIGFAEAAGLSTQAMGTLEAVKFGIERSGVALDQRAIEAYGEIYDNADEKEKQFITLSIVGPRASGFLAYLLQEERITANQALATLRSSVADGDSVEELREARFLYKMKVRQARDDTVDRIKAIEQGEAADGDTQLLRTLVDDLKDMAETMLLIDPARAVQTAGIIQGILFRTKVKGVEFRIEDIVPSATAQIELAASMIIDAADSEAALAFLTDANTDRLTGILNERMMRGIMDRVEIMRTEGADEEMQQRAAQEAQLMSGNASALTANEQKIIALEAEYEEYLAHKDEPNRPFGSTKRGSELPVLIRFHKLLRFFAGTTERQLGGFVGDAGRN